MASDIADGIRVLNIGFAVAVLILAVACLPSWRAASEPVRLLMMSATATAGAAAIISGARTANGFPSDLWSLATTVALALTGRALYIIWRTQRARKVQHED